MPSVVGTSTTGAATVDSFRRKGFYAAGHFWIFWSDGTDLVYSCSADGTNWSAKQTARATCTGGFFFSIWFDGTYLHYAYANAGSLYYRRGTPNSNHSITWSAEEQTVATIYSLADYPFVCVDSSGYAWIGYRDDNGIGHVPHVIKSGNNNGTWGTTPVGFPYELSATNANSWKVTVVPLTELKMYVMWARDTYAGYGKLYDAGWGSAETPAADCEYGISHSVVAEGDHVHVVYLHDTLSTGIKYRKRTYGTGWGSEATVQASAASYMHPVLTRDTVTGDLYCFWIGAPTANHIYYKKCVSGTWDTDPTDWITEADTITGNDRMTSFYNDYGTYKGVIYSTKTGSPYDIKFAYFTVIEVRIASATVGVAGVTKRSSVLTRLSAASIASASTALHSLIIKRFTIATVSLVGTANRIIMLVRRATAIIGVIGSTKRILVIAKAVTAAVALAGSSKRSFIVIRVGAAAISLVATKVRLAVNVRLATVVVTMVAGRTRLIALVRTSIAAVNLVGSRVRLKITIRNAVASVIVFGSTVRRLLLIRTKSGAITSVGTAMRLAVKSRIAAATVTLAAIAKRGARAISIVVASISTLASAIGTFVVFLVTTLDATVVAQTSAVLKGNVSLHNIARGFDWGKETGVYTDSWSEEGGFDSGDFEHLIEGLDPDTNYFFRAKAKKG